MSGFRLHGGPPAPPGYSSRAGSASPSATSPEQTPFCTSPSQLDEALGQTFAEAFARPSTSKSSPLRGRTMKDYEEKQAQLKKENFNLKLRIYFLEERMGQIAGLKDKEEAIKNNIELNVENESMRKELSEKQELLCQAAKALDLLEEQKKEEKSRLMKECSTLQLRVQELEKELQESALLAQQSKFSAMTQSTDSQYSSACFEVDQLTAQVQELQEQHHDDKSKISRLEAEFQNLNTQCEAYKTTINSQNDILLKLEEVTGVKEAELFNRVQQLLDAEKLVSELQDQLKAQEGAMLEREARHSKVKANAANLVAKLNAAAIEQQRLREEVKALKKQKQDDLNRRPSECPNCASEKQNVLAKTKEVENNHHTLKQNALIMRELMSDLTKCKEETKIKDLTIAELQQKLSNMKLESKRTTEKGSSNELAQDREYRLQSIEASLKEKESQLVACEQRLEARDNQIQELELEIQSLRKDYRQISDANTLTTKSGVQEMTCNVVSHENISAQMLEKDKEIETLNMELRKRTFNLQELVNKELWDKNKQIERLELRLAAQGAVCNRKEIDLKEAKRKLAEFGVTVTSLPQTDIASDDVTELQEQLKISLEEQKYLCKEVESLKERLRNTPERDSESIRLQKLLVDNKKLQEAEENHRLWRREASKALAVLRTRLEELAIFLDDLLHQPALVVGLCADRQRVLREAINGSLELSRTIANLSSESLPDDCSHLQCTEGNGSLFSLSHGDVDSICSHLGGSKTTCDSTLCNVTGDGSQKSINSPHVKTERQDHIDLVVDAVHNIEKARQSAALRTRRRSRSQPRGSSQTKSKEGVQNQNTGSQCDSDAWSEPDRSVSQARMGIHNDSSRTASSVASTVRKVSIGGQSSSSSCDADAHPTKQLNCAAVKVAEDQKLNVRTHCLEKLNQALENELHNGCALSPMSGNLNEDNSPSEVLSRANSALSEKVILQEKQHRDRQTELLDMKYTLTEMTSEDGPNLSSQTLRGLEEKVQELSVQVLEVEVSREQAEQEARRAWEEKDRLQRELGGKLAAAQNEIDQARQELLTLQGNTKQLLSVRFDLEREVKHWKGRAQELEKELEKWKRTAQKCETEAKELHSQVSHKFNEKLQVLEQLKNAAEQRAEDLSSKLNEAETKCLEVERRGKDKVRLMEEQLKLKQAEIERRSEELQERLKREAEIRASRKLEKIVEQRMADYDLESRALADKRLRDVEVGLLSQIDDLKKKAADTATDAQKQIQELHENIRIKEMEFKEKLAKAECKIQAEGELQHQLNEAAVVTSQAQLETARLANEKLQLEQQVRWLQGEAMRDRKQLQDQLTSKILSLTQANSELQKHVRDLEREIHQNQLSQFRGSSSQISGRGSASSEGKVLTEITNFKLSNTDVPDYLSEHEEHGYPDSNHPCWYKELPPSPPAVVLTADGNTVSVGNFAGRVTTASPDLGIESDQGRFSSLEPFPLKKSTTAPALNVPDDFPASFQFRKKQHLDYKGLEQENQELKHRLQHTRQTLEQTYAQLAAANQRKRLVEKAICKQLHKTHHILRRARDNFETNAPATSQPEDNIK